MMDFERELCGLAGDRVKKDEPLSRHTTFRIGGPADYFVTPESEDELAAVVALCRRFEIPFFLLGNGSDLLCADDGYRGVAVNTTACLNSVRTEGFHVFAGAGALLGSVAREALSAGLSGLEFASGIPGTLGGAMYMNAGAYKSDISACLKEVCVCRDHTLVWMKKEELDYAYRHSAFQSHPEWTIIAGKLQLSKSCQKEIRSLMDARRERRLSSQPLDLPNCGSVFRNPPQHPAWQLIEEIGYRGRKIGGAMVSDKHANFIVNVGSAKAKDVDQLIQEIQEKISEQYGIDLITEVERFNWNS